MGRVGSRATRAADWEELGEELVPTTLRVPVVFEGRREGETVAVRVVLGGTELVCRARTLEKAKARMALLAGRALARFLAEPGRVAG